MDMKGEKKKNKKTFKKVLTKKTEYIIIKEQ